MKQSEIIVGGRYTAEVSGKIVALTVKTITANSDGRIRYNCFNENTRREITVKSAMRFRARLGQPISQMQFGAKPPHSKIEQPIETRPRLLKEISEDSEQTVYGILKELRQRFPSYRDDQLFTFWLGRLRHSGVDISNFSRAVSFPST